MQTAETKKSSATVCTFPNINPAEDAIKQRHYNDYYRVFSNYRFFPNETVKIEPAEGPKNLHLVCFNRTIGETEYVELLRAIGKRPCRNAPAYLTCLVVQVPEDKMPAELRNKHIVAAEPDNKFSVFTDEFCFPCFRCVRRDSGGRELRLIRVGGDWLGTWAFLAEDLVP